MENFPEKPLVHQLEETKPLDYKKTFYAVLIIIVSGVLSGFLLSKFSQKAPGATLPGENKETTKAQKVVGSADAKTFRDSAEGILETGGIDSEGTHKLIRPGGESQTVYLTSSVLDLSQFIGRKVRVWGETNAAQKAGWLMDVGKMEVL